MKRQASSPRLIGNPSDESAAPATIAYDGEIGRKHPILSNPRCPAGRHSATAWDRRQLFYGRPLTLNPDTA
jgi:hypothetical protein